MFENAPLGGLSKKLIQLMGTQKNLVEWQAGETDTLITGIQNQRSCPQTPMSPMCLPHSLARHRIVKSFPRSPRQCNSRCGGHIRIIPSYVDRQTPMIMPASRWPDAARPQVAAGPRQLRSGYSSCPQPGVR